MPNLVEYVEGIVHEPTQTEGRGVDLTVAAVHDVAGAGRVDFGGGELDVAPMDERDPLKRDPDDDYGWWTLEGPDTYLLEYNERLSLPDDAVATVQPREAICHSGAFHRTVQTRSLDRTPLLVPEVGLDLKENARVSTLVDVVER